MANEEYVKNAKLGILELRAQQREWKKEKFKDQAKFSKLTNITSICAESVVDTNTLYLDPDPGFWANLYPDPDPGLYYQCERKI